MQLLLQRRSAAGGKRELRQRQRLQRLLRFCAARQLQKKFWRIFKFERVGHLDFFERILVFSNGFSSFLDVFEVAFGLGFDLRETTEYSNLCCIPDLIPAVILCDSFSKLRFGFLPPGPVRDELIRMLSPSANMQRSSRDGRIGVPVFCGLRRYRSVYFVPMWEGDHHASFLPSS